MGDDYHPAALFVRRLDKQQGKLSAPGDNAYISFIYCHEQPINLLRSV
jgi:hypothetical protein